ncbi:hypothetical protein ABPG73_003065 [Tetrahymena malaccensis]
MQDDDKFSNEVIFKGLSLDVDEKDIRNYLDQKCGSISKFNLLKNEQGLSKGIAIVSFETEEGCNKAIELNNSDFIGRYLHIEKTKPKNEKPAHLYFNEDSKTIFVGNLTFRTNKETLMKFFASCGKVVDARIAEAEGKSRGFGHVEFQDISGVVNALKKAGRQLDGRPIKVDIAAQRIQYVALAKTTLAAKKPVAKKEMSSYDNSESEEEKQAGQEQESEDYEDSEESEEQKLIASKAEKMGPAHQSVNEDSKTIFIDNLSFRTNKETLLKFFTSFSNIASASITEAERKCKGFGYIEFEDRSAFESALKNTLEQIDGRPIKVNFTAKIIQSVAKKESTSSDDSESEEEKPAANKQTAQKQESQEYKDNDEESDEQKPVAKKVEKKEVKEESTKGDKFSNEVIIKGLSFNADENDIGNYLDEKCGSVIRVNILKNEQGCSKGIAFVSFETEEGCNKAVELNNSDFMGRFIIIEKTNPKTERPAHLPVDEDSKTIFVSNLSFKTDKETLMKFFASCGKVVHARIAEVEGKSRGFGHVEFEDISGVINALKKAGEQLDGRPIKVDVAATRGKRESFNRSNGNFNNNRGDFSVGNNTFTTMQAIAKKESSSSDSNESEEEKPATNKLAAQKQESEDFKDRDEESENKSVAKKAEKKEVKEESTKGDKFSNQVIIKGLSFNADENDIGNYLDEKCGSIIRVNILKNEQGCSKGIAFVSFETEEGCNKAVELNNSDFMGRFIIIEKTNPKTERPAHLPVDEDSKTIFVSNLSFKTDKETLMKFFASCGKVVHARIAEVEGKSRGFGHVEFEDISGVVNALKKAGEQLDGRPIKVDVAATRGKRESFNRSNGNFNNNRGDFSVGNNTFTTMQAIAKKESSSSDSNESDEKKPAANKLAAQNKDRDEESEKQKPVAKKVEKNEVEEESTEGDKFSNEVIVKGLSFDADENDIGNYLDEKCGSIIRVNILKNEQGCSKGIAFVSFETEEGCNKAVELNNSDFMGRYIIIEKTNPKTERPTHLNNDEESKTIFVGNLSFKTDKETIKKFFSSCGKVADACIAEAEGKSRGFGFVEFEDRSCVENALKKVGEQIDGRPIKVEVMASRDNNSFINERKGDITQLQGKVQSLSKN